MSDTSTTATADAPAAAVSDAQDWQRRDGYDGPESFPREVMGYVHEESDALAGRELVVTTADGRRITVQFGDRGTLTVADADDRPSGPLPYRAYESPTDVFFVSYEYPDDGRRKSVLVVDLAHGTAVIVHSVVPSDTADGHQVALSHISGTVDVAGADITVATPGPVEGLPGFRFVLDYDGQYVYEIDIISETLMSWRGIVGNVGLQDTEEYTTTELAPGLFVLSWSEHVETLALTMLVDLNARRSHSTMVGYVPTEDLVLAVALGAEVIDSSRIGVAVRSVDAAESGPAAEAHRDVIARSHLQVWNEGRFDLIPEIYHEDFAAHFVTGIEVRGREAFQAFIEDHRVTFPDWTERIDDIFVTGDRAAVRYTSTGTHVGEFMGVAGTDRPIVVNETSLYRMAEGKIVEQWGFPDALHLIQQISE
ncbi:ester cyclase [Microbacterium sp. NPDC089695]|uniref:ester cyclase n=1 Tax=Microbacterium sp. NPDC089695 TaxID=3364198 RepID=UPI0037F2A3EF